MLDPMRFAGGPALAGTVEQIARALSGEPGAPLMPGDPEIREDAVRRVKGIPVEPVLAQQMREWSDRLKVGRAIAHADVVNTGENWFTFSGL
jgi:ureidoglycolate dehydrogenase (NAD+)